jgi:hypothetical protein
LVLDSVGDCGALVRCMGLSAGSLAAADRIADTWLAGCSKMNNMPGKCQGYAGQTARGAAGRRRRMARGVHGAAAAALDRMHKIVDFDEL